MSSKQSKYCIKIWATCVAGPSYSWNIQVYMGKPADSVPEKNQVRFVVLEIDWRSDNFFIT